ncbi:type II secretion system protein GspL [Sphingosinicella sp.]|uniref:type II secretion system protein GspL n=1 Tax=Sphingosinicella sp. TaxID=1917971 RepID=UPI004037D85E
MPTSPTDDPPAEGTLLAFAGEGDIARWLLIGDDGGITRGEGALPPVADGRTAIAVPGEAVAIHWLTLDEGLAPAQAVAAARLMLADASLAPLADMHVAVGAAEGGRTPVALVPNERMTAWLATAEAAGLDADPVMPTPFLLGAPADGFARLQRGAVADYRGLGAAFAIEPELADALTGDATVADVDETAFEAGLAEALAAPALNLRQGAFARRRRLRIVEGSWRRLALYGLALAALTLIIQIAAILSYTFAADRLETEVAQIGRGDGGARGAGFGPVASLLFEAIRSTPNAELTRLDWRADGSLAVSLRVDTPATLAALRARAEASGLRIEGGAAPNGDVADLVVRL